MTQYRGGCHAVVTYGFCMAVARDGAENILAPLFYWNVVDVPD